MKKLLILALSLSASTLTLAQTVTYLGAPDTIDDNNLATPLCTTVTMPGSATVSSANFVQVDFAATHSWVGDLHITLESPTGTVIMLRDRGGVTGDSSNLDAANPISFFDTAANAIADIGANCTNTEIIGVDCPEVEFVPTEPLSTFNTEAAAGTWTLCVADGAGGDTGDLTSWSMVGDGSLPVELQTFSID